MAEPARPSPSTAKRRGPTTSAKGLKPAYAHATPCRLTLAQLSVPEDQRDHRHPRSSRSTRQTNNEGARHHRRHGLPSQDCRPIVTHKPITCSSGQQPTPMSRMFPHRPRRRTRQQNHRREGHGGSRRALTAPPSRLDNVGEKLPTASGTAVAKVHARAEYADRAAPYPHNRPRRSMSNASPGCAGTGASRAMAARCRIGTICRVIGPATGKNADLRPPLRARPRAANKGKRQNEHKTAGWSPDFAGDHQLK